MKTNGIKVVVESTVVRSNFNTQKRKLDCEGGSRIEWTGKIQEGMGVGPSRGGRLNEWPQVIMKSHDNLKTGFTSKKKLRKKP